MNLNLCVLAIFVPVLLNYAHLFVISHSRVLSYPENPPQINFEEYRKKVSSKDAVNQLESAYKALKVTYPKDTLSQEVDKQEEEYKKKALAYVDVANAKIAEAEKLVSHCGDEDHKIDQLKALMN